jgi:hypothetical protein
VPVDADRLDKWMMRLGAVYSAATGGREMRDPFTDAWSNDRKILADVIHDMREAWLDELRRTP